MRTLGFVRAVPFSLFIRLARYYFNYQYHIRVADKGLFLVIIQILQSYFDNLNAYVGFCPSRAFLVIHPNKSRHRGNGIACVQATPRVALGFCSANRAENLCYRFNHGQKLLPKFRKIVGLVVLIGWDTHTRFGSINKIQNSPCHSERSRRI